MDREIKRKNPRLRRALVIAGVSVAAVAGVAWVWTRASSTVYRADATALLIGEVTEGEFNDYIRLTGKVETGTVVQVSALESGIVEAKLVEEGARVNAGDVLLTLRNTGLQQEILDSESQLAERQNMLRDTEIAMEKERLQLRQDLLQTRSETGRLERIFSQQKTLYDEHLVSREDFLRAREDYELGCEKLKLLEERIHQDSLYRSVQIVMMRESLDNMRRNFELVRGRADNLNIRASRSGQLGTLDAELGQNIPAGSLVGQINILDNYKVSVLIDEHYIDRVTRGLHGSLSGNRDGIAVSVSKVYPEVSDGRFRADLTFDGECPANLRVGQTFRVDLRLGDAAQAVMVPRGSFFQTTGGRWVYVLDPDGKSARRRAVKIGRQNPQYFEVTEGLAPGERIITSSYAEYGGADKIIIKDK